MLREKLSVMDEVTNGLSYFDHTFLRELPRLYASVEDRLATRDRAGGAGVPNFMKGQLDRRRPGRQPFVTAEILEKALAVQAEKSSHPLPGRGPPWAAASIAQGAGEASDALLRLAEALARTARPPFRRALPPRPHWRYARLAATYQRACWPPAAAPCGGPRRPTTGPDAAGRPATK